MQAQTLQNKSQIIPNKIYFNIGEVSNLCSVKPHVLRYWEQEFPQLKPMKRRGNRRYYQRKDVLLVRQIKSLLYEQGFTIEGAKIQLSKHSLIKEQQNLNSKKLLDMIVDDLEALLTELETEEGGA